jgi:hypothetical protein
MTEKKDDNLNVLVRSDAKSEDKEIGAESEEEIDEYDEDIYDEDEDDVDYPNTEPSRARQRSVRPAVYGVLAVAAVIAAFLIGSLIGKVTEEPEPVMTAEPIVETAIPEITATPEATVAPSASPVSEEESEAVTENKEDIDDEQNDEHSEEDEEAHTDEEESEAVATPETSATPTPDPSIYNGVAPVIGGTKPASGTSTASSTPTPSKPDDTAVNAAASRLMANRAGMSRAELVSGLLSSGYTLEQADRAADNIAVSWTQQAIYRAMSIYDRNTDNRNTLIVELVLAGFSQSDAQAAADAVGA